MNRPWLTIGLLIGLFAAATLLMDAPPEVFEPPPLSDERERELQLTGYITGVDSVQFNELGAVQRHFKAERMSHFQRNAGKASAEDYTAIEKPAFVFFQADSPPWYVTAAEGRSSAEDSLLTLRDDVRLWQQAPQRANTLITTSELMIWSDSQVAETDQFVMITRPQMTMHGVGMRADLNQETLSIRSQGSTTYDPKPQPTE